MGNLYPSFMLLSARNSGLESPTTQKEAVITQLCFLPNQTFIYLWYLLLFIMTLILLLRPTISMGFWHCLTGVVMSSKELVKCIIFRRGTKEKNDEDDGEYEMIWDAEGSMHLIKKKTGTPVRHSIDKGVVERGSAVARPTAKKSVGQDMEAGMKKDIALPISVHRRGNSRTRVVVYRLLRTFQMLAVIAAVNIPLYMMLLFKDWVER